MFICIFYTIFTVLQNTQVPTGEAIYVIEINLLFNTIVIIVIIAIVLICILRYLFAELIRHVSSSILICSWRAQINFTCQLN